MGFLHLPLLRCFLLGFPVRGLLTGEDYGKATPFRPCCSYWLWMCSVRHMISRAAELGLLQPLSRRALQHRVSLYAHKVVLFLRPEADDIAITMDILQLFSDSSGLKTNLQKSNVLPIRCGEQELELIQQHLPCELADFPCKYLGLPLSIK